MSDGRGDAPQVSFTGRAEQVHQQPGRANGQGAVAPGLVSIVMPCCGQLEYTRLSVPRLLRHSRPPFELIFVDVGSLDGTPEYLAGVAAGAPMRVEVVSARMESAFPAAVGEALGRARGGFVVWMNNDVLVPPLWLQQLVALATANAAIGMVGPVANIAPAQQRVPAAYRLPRRRGTRDALGGEVGECLLETEAVDRFAAEFRERHAGQWSEVERLGGFCFLVKREVLGGAGLLGTSEGVGLFDADALCVRVRREGYRLTCCRDLFVHHFGSRVMAR